MLSALLAGLAVAVLFASPPRGHRLTRLAQQLGSPDPVSNSPPVGRTGVRPTSALRRLRRRSGGSDSEAQGRAPASVGARMRALSAPGPAGACALAGVAAYLVVGGLLGLLLAAVLVLAGPPALARLPSRADQERMAALTRDLPLALDLLSACLAGGAPLQAAIPAAAAAVGGECGDRLGRVAAALTVGTPPLEAWAYLGTGTEDGAAGPAGRALARAGETGAPVAAAVARVAADARVQARAASTEAARRAGVLAVAPLGLCFLPAFVLLGVVPVVIGLASPLLASL